VEGEALEIAFVSQIGEGRQVPFEGGRGRHAWHTRWEIDEPCAWVDGGLEYRWERELEMLLDLDVAGDWVVRCCAVGE
jgi:hypothetical protein